MSLIKFRKIILEQGQTVENWLGENNLDENTRYTFYNEDESEILGEYIGNKKVVKDVQVFSGDFNDLTNKPSIPSNTSQLTNDSGFLTEHQDLSGHAKKDDLFSKNYNDLTNKPTKLSDFDNDEDFTTKTYVDTEINTKLSSGIEEAPQDGKLYGRKDGAWVEINIDGSPADND